jgi:hypothetical protein
MAPFEEVFYATMEFGFSIRDFASFAAGWILGSVGRSLLLTIVVLSLWAAMFLGSDLRYRAWQAIYDPAPEASYDFLLPVHFCWVGFRRDYFARSFLG